MNSGPNQSLQANSHWYDKAEPAISVFKRSENPQAGH